MRLVDDNPFARTCHIDGEVKLKLAERKFCVS